MLGILLRVLGWRMCSNAPLYVSRCTMRRLLPWPSMARVSLNDTLQRQRMYQSSTAVTWQSWTYVVRVLHLRSSGLFHRVWNKVCLTGSTILPQMRHFTLDEIIAVSSVSYRSTLTSLGQRWNTFWNYPPGIISRPPLKNSKLSVNKWWPPDNESRPPVIIWSSPVNK